MQYAVQKYANCTIKEFSRVLIFPMNAINSVVVLWKIKTVRRKPYQRLSSRFRYNAMNDKDL